MPRLPPIPSPNQIIHGKHRKMWVHDAAKAVIATTDVELRYLLVKAGVVEFIRVARPYFHTLAGFHFSEDELRWAFMRIQLSVPPLILQFGVGALLGATAKRATVEDNKPHWSTPLVETESSPVKRTVPL